MAPTKEPTEADIIFNRASVALARSQRLIASWLPPKTAEEIANTKSEEDLEREEKELFAPVPELLGVGAPLPKEISEGSLNRRRITTNDKLLQQLIGKKAAKERMQAAQNSTKSSTHALAATKATRPGRRANVDEDSDEEEGRSASFKSKKAKAASKPKPSQSVGEESIQEANSQSHKRKLEADSDLAEDESKTSTIKAPEASNTLQAEAQQKSKRPMSFLDEVLGERKKKKKKKKHHST